MANTQTKTRICPLVKSTEERADAIRADLKKAGFNRRSVTVRRDYFSMGSAIDVTVHDPSIPLQRIRDIATGYERIDRCEYSGEILSGCNVYLEVRYSDKARQARINEAMPVVNIAIERLEGHAPGDTALEPCLGGLIGWDWKCSRYEVQKPDGRHGIAFNAEGIAAMLRDC